MESLLFCDTSSLHFASNIGAVIQVLTERLPVNPQKKKPGHSARVLVNHPASTLCAKEDVVRQREQLLQSFACFHFLGACDGSVCLRIRGVVFEACALLARAPHLHQPGPLLQGKFHEVHRSQAHQVHRFSTSPTPLLEMLQEVFKVRINVQSNREFSTNRTGELQTNRLSAHLPPYLDAAVRYSPAIWKTLTLAKTGSASMCMIDACSGNFRFM